MPVVRGKLIEPLFTAEQIAERNRAIAAQIATRPAKDLLVIAILKGSFIFAADLLRALHDVGLAPEVEFITLSSYGTGTVSQGVRIVKDIDSDVKDRDVLLIDDILESGRTLLFAKQMLYERGANSVSIAVLLDKRVKRKEDLEADFVGFECPDYFVVGYGMDAAYAFRELPFVGVVTGDA
ncbi:hypoxanthine phosphoribosyltransferase [Neorhizobium lilium]|uniref:Hypoxanthine phosphoribosyltransferase n=1 Tax=Neorhizobium lilium TaxID=2503024 RepID=A0A444L9Z7_9HYPH|nr:hypoxanthine phosphoribosyltransferase [Neorhizobium lilium]RWX74393.1 hypoxanthine phosphoribosyltransferase [Neorhizobium lilium]